MAASDFENNDEPQTAEGPVADRVALLSAAAMAIGSRILRA